MEQLKTPKQKNFAQTTSKVNKTKENSIWSFSKKNNNAFCTLIKLGLALKPKIRVDNPFWSVWDRLLYDQPFFVLPWFDTSQKIHFAHIWAFWWNLKTKGFSLVPLFFVFIRKIWQLFFHLIHGDCGRCNLNSFTKFYFFSNVLTSKLLTKDNRRSQ